MFKPSVKDKQLDMFSNIRSMLRGVSSKQFEGDNSWHNQFRRNVVNQIDEDIFKPLYDSRTGAPNAPIRVMVGMMLLKEGFGWSDSELFEQCRFNLLIRSALGYEHVTEAIPSESTYYLFRQKIHGYCKQQGHDLLNEVFSQITTQQIQEFEVSGRKIRMDSKLIGSNIAWSSRYELVHDTLVLFFKSLDKSALSKLTPGILDKLEKLSEKPGEKVVFHSKREELQEKLQSLGTLCYSLLSLFSEDVSPHYLTLKRLFEEHFKPDDQGKAAPRPNNELKSDSMQSPYDQDCSYRDKNGQKVKGYSINITETCDPEDLLNLITDVQTEKVNTPDTQFMQQAVEETSAITGAYAQSLHADGAYHSPANMDYCKERGITPCFTAMQGKVGRYDLELDQQNNLIVTDTHTGEIIPAKLCKNGKWSIKTSKGVRYFSKKDIEKCQERKSLEQIPGKDRKIRNNVEATIFQLAYHTRNNKTRYRGIIKTQMWAILRCLWINFRRIVLFTGKVCPTRPQNAQNTPLFLGNFALPMIFYLKNRIRTKIYRIFEYLGGLFASCTCFQAKIYSIKYSF